jgi:hypothetical protein
VHVVVFLVLVTPMALLGALFAMNVVEQWVDHGTSQRSFEPKIMGNREPVGQSS